MHRLIALALFIPTLALATDPAPIRLKQGEEKVLDVGDYTRLAIGAPEVVAVTANTAGGQLTVVGRGVGKTTLLVWRKKGGRVTYLVDVRSDGRPETKPDPVIAPPRTTELPMFQGEQKVLTFPGLSRIAVGDPKIADVKATADGELLISAVSEGRTTMMIWRDRFERLEYEIAVRPNGSANASLPVVTLRIGERRKLDFANASKIGVPDRAIVEVELGERKTVTLLGKAEGETTFPMWSEEQVRVDYRVIVTR